MPLGSAIVIIANWIAMAMAGGLIFAVLVQPRRELTNYLFSFFSASLGLWAFTSLMGLIPQMRFGLAEITIFNWNITAMALTAGSFYVFTVAFIHPQNRWVSPLMIVLPIVLVISIVLIWSGQAFQNVVTSNGLTNVDVTLIGYAILVLAVAYLGIAFWFIYNSPEKRSQLLRIPALLLAVAYGVNVFDALQTLPIDTLLATIVMVWVGWVVLHFQLFNPLTELNQELRTANRDLQQVVSDLDTEKQRAEKLNRELQSASQVKSEFLANMSHELRTPLNSIIGYSELLHGGVYGELNEKQIDRLEKIHGNGRHLLALINDLLDYNKLEAGRLKLDIMAFKPGMMIDQVVTDIEPQCAQRGLKLVVDLPDDLPSVYGDQNRIRQILDNLLDNAIKFTHEGTITLQVRSVLVIRGSTSDFKLPAIGWLQDGDWLIFSVIDTGIGIGPEDQGQIFDQFSQVDTSRTREYEGTGLGLAIAKRLVEMHDGTIWVKSALGEGSTFFVALPTDVNAHQAAKAAAKTEHVI